MPGRNSQVSRIFAIFDILAGAPQGLTVKELHARSSERGHDAGERTIYRDLEALQQAGFPLDCDITTTRWTVDKTTRLTQYLVLSPPELLALYLARGMLHPLKDTPFYSDLQEVFAKITSKLGEKSQSYFEELSSELRFDPRPRWGLSVDPDVLETVRAACAEQHVLTATYDSAHSGEKRPRLLGPHYIYFSKGSMYLVAEDLETKVTKVFALPRLSGATMMAEPYEGNIIEPEQFFADSMGMYRGGAPVTVTLDIQSRIAPFIRERTWHPSQRVASKQDGGIELALEVAVTPELVNWILGLGPDVKVLGPADLCQQVERQAGRIVSLYSRRQAKRAKSSRTRAVKKNTPQRRSA